MILWTNRVVFFIWYLYCSLPENSFCQVFCRVGTSGLICTANGLTVLYNRSFPAERYCRTNFGISAFCLF